ncbi:MAG TPA: YoaK family protein [Acidimicrobiales bacterium]|nr:YoaK family protein [Acidimicrobiales bacterium]
MTPARRAVALALVGGYVDAVGYVMLRGLFPNHVTGNLPFAAAHGGTHVLPAVLMIPLWLAGVVAAAGVAGEVRQRDPSRVLSTVLALEAALLGAFLLLGVALVPSPDSSTLVTQTIVTGAGVLAMAAQSVVSRLAGYAYPTTMVTGTLTLLGMDGAQVLFRQHAGDDRTRLRGQIGALSRAVAAFAAGAGLGGLAVHRLQFWAIALPVVAITACAISERAGAALPEARHPALPAPVAPRAG